MRNITDQKFALLPEANNIEMAEKFIIRDKSLIKVITKSLFCTLPFCGDSVGLAGA